MRAVRCVLEAEGLLAATTVVPLTEGFEVPQIKLLLASAGVGRHRTAAIFCDSTAAALLSTDKATHTVWSKQCKSSLHQGDWSFDIQWTPHRVRLFAVESIT